MRRRGRAVELNGTDARMTLLDWLSRADFIGPPALSVLWLVFSLMWAAWLFIVKGYYERHA